jgi:hypothetical protein
MWKEEASTRGHHNDVTSLQKLWEMLTSLQKLGEMLTSLQKLGEMLVPVRGVSVRKGVP